MKNLIFFILFVLIAQTSISQVRIGSNKANTPKIKKSKKSTVQEFLSKKTHFILPDKFTKDQYADILQDWPMPYDITYLKNFKIENYKIGDVIAKMETIIKLTTRTKTTSRASVNAGQRFENTRSRTSYNFLNLIEFYIVDDIVFEKRPLLNKRSDKKEFKKRYVGAIFFTTSTQYNISGRLNDFKNINYNIDLQTFELGYLKNFFQQTIKALEQNKTINVLDDLIVNEIHVLSKNVLYVSKEELLRSNESNPPSNITKEYTEYLKKINANREKYTKILDNKMNSIFENYNFKYKFISDKELNEKILNSDENFYYLLSNTINSSKIITITNNKTGKVLFSRHKLGIYGYSINKKDIKALNKAIQNK